MFKTLFSGLLHKRPAKWVLPSQCHICRAWPSAPLCEACVNQFAQPATRCPTCAAPMPVANQPCGACLKDPPPLNQCLAAVAYAYPWSALIQSYKFHAQTGLVRSFATLLRATPWVESALEGVDLLLPMPLSKQRLRARGFNQALLLARALAAAKTRDDVLLKVMNTPAQHTLKRAERLVALNHAFAVKPGLAGELKDKRVVLVDDVMTTGASLYSAARVLKNAGVAHITGLVLARTE